MNNEEAVGHLVSAHVSIHIAIFPERQSPSFFCCKTGNAKVRKKANELVHIAQLVSHFAYNTLKYRASGWAKTIAETDASGSIM
ncbi:hypothetical protein P9743_08260 [Anoxybacillus geothermalis]|nr:hypothetical protein [Anoxybacillus geothermalis]MED4924189.1 hypothetical protein [Anoxybacillus geothermalis]